MGLKGWKYVREIQINNGSVGLQDYVLRLELDSGNFDFSKPKPDGSDIRFTDSDSVTLLDYYIEDYDYDNQKATIYVKVPSIPANQTKLIYIYYGNINATSQSDESIITSGFLYDPDPFNDNSCVAFYPFDEDANDHSGNGHHGVWNGNEQYDTGMFKQAVRFDGSSYISLDDTLKNLIGANSFSVVFWYRDYNGPVLATSHYTPGWPNTCYGRKIYPNAFYRWTGGNAYDQALIVDYSFSPNVFYNTIITYDVSSGDTVLYINGNKEGNKVLPTSSNGIDPYNTGLNCGVVKKGSTWYASGVIDHIRIFNRVLTTDEVQVLSCNMSYIVGNEILQSKLSGVIYDKYRRRIRNKQVKIFIIDKDSGNLYGSTTSNNDGTWDILLPISPDTKVLTVMALEGEYHGDVDIAGAEFDITKNS